MLVGYVGKDHINVSIGFLLFGALCATGLDGVGGIPFLRAVKPRQRREMTSVYRTYIEFSDLLPGFLFMGLLLYFDVGIVFITLSILMVFMAAISWRYLPKSM